MTLKLYGAPQTRAVRVAWLLEELELRYELISVRFIPTTDKFFIQDTPTGKIPTLADGEVVISESDAIIEYLLERYGKGRLAPARDDPKRAEFLQWFHFAESTGFAPIGIVVWLTRYRDDASYHSELLRDAKVRVQTTLAPLADRLVDRQYLMGDTFTAADVMLGFTVGAAASLGLLEKEPVLREYLGRLQQRAAFERAINILSSGAKALKA